MKRRQPEIARFEGVIVDAVTPRRAEEHSIDLGATLELIDYLAESGAQGIALLASLGEFVHFALDDRRHMVNFAAKRSRLPLLVNVTHSTLDGTIMLAREAASSGVAGVMLMPPYYFRYRQETMRAFFLACAAGIGDAAPIFLANVPEFTNGLESSTASGLLATGLFKGMIESSASLEAIRAVVEETQGCSFTLLAGRDCLYCQARDLGARGVVSAAACAVPELMVALDRALKAGEQPRVARLQAILTEFLDWLDQFPPPAAIKEAVRQRKLKVGVFGMPLGPEQDRKMDEFREWFRAWLPGVLRECQPQA
jgi:dihydrodipicolinate synthase/N-acetylneuraminate lyase